MLSRGEAQSCVGQTISHTSRQGKQSHLWIHANFIVLSPGCEGRRGECDGCGVLTGHPINGVAGNDGSRVLSILKPVPACCHWERSEAISPSGSSLLIPSLRRRVRRECLLILDGLLRPRYFRWTGDVLSIAAPKDTFRPIVNSGRVKKPCQSCLSRPRHFQSAGDISAATDAQ